MGFSYHFESLSHSLTIAVNQYGFGMQISTDTNLQLWHKVSALGYSSCISFFPRTEKTLILLSNQYGGNFQYELNDIIQKYFSAFLDLKNIK